MTYRALLEKETILYTCTASLVLYNTSEVLIEGVVRSLPADTCLYVIDNSPVPLHKSFCEAFSCVAKYTHPGRNLGYGRGHNLALAQSPPSRFHLVMNPDILIEPSHISELILFLENNPDVGMVSPQIRNTDGTLQHLNRRYPTVWDLFLRSAVPGFLFEARRAWHEMRDVGYGEICDVESVSGAFMLCRRNLLDRLGGFDPRYFMYFEDFDLSRSFQAFGARTVYYPYVSAIHGWERASYKNISLTIIHLVNMVHYFNKWGWKWY